MSNKSRRIIGISPWPFGVDESDVNYYNKYGSKKSMRMPLKEANKLIVREKRRKGFSHILENAALTNRDELKSKRINKFGDTKKVRFIKTVTDIISRKR